MFAFEIPRPAVIIANAGVTFPISITCVDFNRSICTTATITFNTKNKVIITTTDATAPLLLPPLLTYTADCLHCNYNSNYHNNTITNTVSMITTNNTMEGQLAKEFSAASKMTFE